MPRLPIDYSRTIIYKLCCKDPSITDIYVGHTTDVIRRKRQHKYCCNTENKKYNFYVYQFIRDNGGWDNFDMIVIEELSCENKYQAEQRERYWLEELKATLNKQVPTRTIQEYREEYREQKQEYNKEYYETNKEQILEQQKEYKEQNKETINEKAKEKIVCECGSNVRKSDLARHRKSQKHLDYLNN